MGTWANSEDHDLHCLLRLETPNDVRSVALESKNIQATSKGSGQTAHMRRQV